MLATLGVQHKTTQGSSDLNVFENLKECKPSGHLNFLGDEGLKSIYIFFFEANNFE